MKIKTVSPVLFNTGDSGSTGCSSGRHFIAIFPSEKEVVLRLTSIFNQVLPNKVEKLKFNKDGNLLITWRETQEDEENPEEDDTIRIGSYSNSKEFLLTMEIFDCDGEVMEDNLMIMYHLQLQLNFKM
ncbi:MAG: hypothetical protein WC499_00700 [Patescibacteria group bacterium]